MENDELYTELIVEQNHLLDLQAPINLITSKEFGLFAKDITYHLAQLLSQSARVNIIKDYNPLFLSLPAMPKFYGELETDKIYLISENALKLSPILAMRAKTSENGSVYVIPQNQINNTLSGRNRKFSPLLTEMYTQLILDSTVQSPAKLLATLRENYGSNLGVSIVGLQHDCSFDKKKAITNNSTAEQHINYFFTPSSDINVYSHNLNVLWTSYLSLTSSEFTFILPTATLFENLVHDWYQIGDEVLEGKAAIYDANYPQCSLLNNLQSLCVILPLYMGDKNLVKIQENLGPWALTSATHYPYELSTTDYLEDQMLIGNTTYSHYQGHYNNIRLVNSLTDPLIRYSLY
jgi:hypothetical protein